MDIKRLLFSPRLCLIVCAACFCGYRILDTIYKAATHQYDYSYPGTIIWLVSIGLVILVDSFLVYAAYSKKKNLLKVSNYLQYALLAILLILYIVCVILIVYLGIVGLQRKAIVATSKRYGYLMGPQILLVFFVRKALQLCNEDEYVE